MATIHTNLSDDSTLSNDSSSENSTSSLDHEVRLSNARLSSSGRMSGSGSGGGAAAAKDADRDMTEDEVAIMVKNALRKARRAMNNSSPMSDDDDGDDDDKNNKSNKSVDKDDDDDDDLSTGGGYGTSPSKFSNSGGLLDPSKSISDEVDFDMDMESPTNNNGILASLSDKSEDMDGNKSGSGGGSGNDLAKRIEEEIQSARAFAEKKYYSVDDDEKKNEVKKKKQHSDNVVESKSSSSPQKGERTTTTPLGRKTSSTRSAHSIDTADTPLASNRVGKTTKPSTPSSANTPNQRDIADLPTPKASPNRNNVSSSSASTPRESARERIARSKDKIAAANEKLLKKTTASSSTPVAAGTTIAAGSTTIALPTTPGGSSALRPPKTPKSPDVVPPSNNPKTPNPKTPGQSEFDAILAVSPSPLKVPTTVVARSPSAAAAATATTPSNATNNSIGLKKSLSNDPSMEENDSSILNTTSSSTPPSSNNNVNNKPPLSSVVGHAHASPAPPPPPPNTNSNKPREHRQVLFRHPYPLPPPPPLPRSDDIIISSHSAPEKNINIRWVEPDNDLAALIEAAGEEYNLVRRSNACGALKVLASKDSNKPRLCRTTGLLDVLVKASWDDAVDSDALDARTRAVTTLLYLSEPKDNRLIIARHPQMLELLVKVIEEDTGEARWRATSALATLAKTPGNRGSMGSVENLPTVLADLMIIGQKERKAAAEAAAAAAANNKTEGGEEGGGEDGNPDGVLPKNGTESREDDNSRGESMSRGPTFDTMDDERMLTHTYTGTFTDGTGTTFTEDDMTYQSMYDSDGNTLEGGEEDMDEDAEGRSTRSEGDDEEEDGTQGGSVDYPSDDEGSVQEEEGVEMQISSLKKLNIENASDFLAKSQLSACATLTHLSKHCANAPVLCTNEKVLDNIIFLAGIFDSPLHTRCIEMLCNFTRFPSNNAKLANMPKAIETLLLCGKSKIAEDRMWSIRTIQNLCSDASSKVGLATNSMLSLLSTAAMRKDYEEQYAAVGALMNLSTEPGSIVPLTNTKTVVATLVHLAHSPNTPSAVRKIACDSLATIGLWLQTLASAGTVPEEIPFSPLPTHSATGWLRWDN